MTEAAAKPMSDTERAAMVPPEGRPNFMFEHPFGLRRYALADDILEEQALMPMRDGNKLAASARP